MQAMRDRPNAANAEEADNNELLNEVEEQALAAALRGLEWKDTYFNQSEDILAVFEFDRRKLMLAQLVELLIVLVVVVGIAVGIAILARTSKIVVIIPMVSPFIINWARSYRQSFMIHIALTRRGVVYAVESRRYGSPNHTVENTVRCLCSISDVTHPSVSVNTST